MKGMYYNPHLKEYQPTLTTISEEFGLSISWIQKHKVQLVMRSIYKALNSDMSFPNKKHYLFHSEDTKTLRIEIKERIWEAWVDTNIDEIMERPHKVSGNIMKLWDKAFTSFQDLGGKELC